MLRVRDLVVMAGGQSLLQNISFDLSPGDWLMLVGPNGAGKSTMLNAISQALTYRGSVTFDGQDLARMKPRLRAGCLGVLSQRHAVGYAFTVLEVVRLGRYAARGSFFSRKGDPQGQGLIDRAIAMTGLETLLDHSVLTLSGGELQRVFLAQLFAQNPRLLLLDEPANHLDLLYQQQLFGLLEEWLRTPGRALISVVHDLSLARKYGNRTLLLHQGRLAAAGEVKDALTPQTLQSVYQMDVFAWMRGLLEEWQA
jgi:iron complex transport system ATP-binding protein